MEDFSIFGSVFWGYLEVLNLRAYWCFHFNYLFSFFIVPFYSSSSFLLHLQWLLTNGNSGIAFGYKHTTLYNVEVHINGENQTIEDVVALNLLNQRF